MQQDDYDLALVDLCLPDASGLALSERLLCLSNLQTVLLAGGAPRLESTAYRTAIGSGLPVLEKPFDADELINSITRVLRASTPSSPHPLPTDHIPESAGY